MAWNKPSEGAAKPTPKKPSAMRGVVAGLVVVAIAAAAAYFLLFSGDKAKKPVREDAKKGLIKEVTPAAAPTNAVGKAKKPRIEYKQLPDGGMLKYVNGKRATLHPEYPPCKYGVTTQRVDRSRMQMESRIFQTSTDRQLAYVLNAEPGEEFGDGLDTKNFTRDFLKSLNVPIEITPEDTEDERELKQAVIEARKEIKALYDKGENINDVIDKAIVELQELGQYRAELMKQVDKISRDPTTTSADMKDLQAACKEMLEKKGIRMTLLPKLYFNRVKRQEKRNAMMNLNNNQKEN